MPEEKQHWPDSGMQEADLPKKAWTAEQSQTIYMPIQQASSSNGKTAEAIVVSSNEKEANKAGVTDVKIVEK